ncbi:hypothetical protein ACEUA8_01485 [Aeromonas veronii]
MQIDYSMGYERPLYDFYDNKDLINRIANNRYEAFISVKHKEQQAKNTYNGCLVGTLAESAVYCYISEYYQVHEVKELEHYLLNKTPYNSLGDIVYRDMTGLNLIEVKGTQTHAPQNMITPYHAHKYHKENIKYVFFVDVDIKTYKCRINGYVTPQQAINEGRYCKTKVDNLDCYYCLQYPDIIKQPVLAAL